MVRPRASVLLAAFLAAGFVSWLVIGRSLSSSEGGREWIRRPLGGFADDAAREIDEADIFEVVASMNDVAVERDLKDLVFKRLTPDEARWFTGHYYNCPNGKAPYLVRAVYGNGGTG